MEKHTCHLLTAILVIVTWFTCSAAGQLFADSKLPRLYARNGEAPFCYRVGGERAWPIFDGPMRDGDSVHLIAQRQKRVLGQGSVLRIGGLRVEVMRQGKLRVTARKDAQKYSFWLTVQLKRGGKKIADQTLEVRPAPPARPISYIADLIDDLIRIFWDSRTGRFRPTEKSGFDQFFRRLQAHGVRRLIVWSGACPMTLDPARVPKESWERYRRQPVRSSQALS